MIPRGNIFHFPHRGRETERQSLYANELEASSEGRQRGSAWAASTRHAISISLVGRRRIDRAGSSLPPAARLRVPHPGRGTDTPAPSVAARPPPRWHGV